MKLDNQQHIRTGVSLEKLQDEAVRTGGQGDPRLSEALRGLQSGQADPHVDTLVQLAGEGTRNRQVAADACLLLADYYMDRFGLLNGRRDCDRAVYYAELARDYGREDEGNYLSACALFSKGDIVKGRDALLSAVRANYAPALRFATQPGIIAALEKYPGLVNSLGSETKDWGLPYLAFMRWSTHPENTSNFERMEARASATQILQDAGKMLDYTEYNRPTNITFFNMLRSFMGIAMESNPTGDDLKRLKDFEHRTEMKYREFSGEFGGIAHSTVLFVLPTFAYIALSIALGRVFVAPWNVAELWPVVLALIEAAICFVSSLLPLLLGIYFHRYFAPNIPKKVYRTLLTRNLILFVVVFVFVLAVPHSTVISKNFYLNYVTGFTTLIYVFVTNLTFGFLEKKGH